MRNSMRGAARPLKPRPGDALPDTHPGVEPVYILVEGGSKSSSSKDSPAAPPRPATVTVAADTPHGGKTGPQPTKILVTYVVDKDRPLASPA